MYPPGTIAKAYHDEFFGKINNSPELAAEFKNNPKWAFQFMLANLKILTEIDEIEREILKVLNSLGTVNNFIIKSYSIEELVIDVKHYLIAWSTMKDLISSLINASFDLGIHENDLSFGLILRNEKVSGTSIPEICKTYAKAINVSYTDKQRNDAIHRGKLLDDEINEYRSRYSSIYSKQYSVLTGNPLPEEEFKATLKEINSELPDLAQRKKKEYSEHFEKTLELNRKLAVEIAKIAANRLHSVRISEMGPE